MKIIIVAWLAMTLAFYLFFRFTDGTFEAKLVHAVMVANVLTVIGVILSGYLWK